MNTSQRNYSFFIAGCWLLSFTACAQKSTNMNDPINAEETPVLAVTRQLTRLMIERDTMAMNKILDKNYTLTHMTGYEQSRSEWFAEVEKESMKYYLAQEVAHSVKIEGNRAEFVQQNLVDARIWGSRNTWRLQQVFQLEKREGSWIILNSVASTFR